MCEEQTYKVGDRVISYNKNGELKRDMTLVSEEIVIRKTKTLNTYKRKLFHFYCNICGWKNGKILETSLKKGRGCGCCNNDVVVKGINDVATTHSELLKYFCNIEDAYKNTYGTQRKVYLKCPDCGFIREMSILQLSQEGFSCPQCSDGLSYPEKFFASLLIQQGIIFKTQLSKSNFLWCQRYKYDFYLPAFNCIVETHGKQHYENSGRRNKTLEEEKLNDREKRNIAIKNGINYYIVLDCRKSEINWIRNSIEKSELSYLLDLVKVDWVLCHKYATKSLILDVCDKWNSGKYRTTNELAKEYSLSRNTIVSYLKQGTIIGWCQYNPKEELRKSTSKNGKLLGKPINVYINNRFVCRVYSAQELYRQSVKLFGRKIYQSDISKICNGQKEQIDGIYLEYADI